jgi:SSS family solute:Na+ symporter
MVVMSYVFFGGMRGTAWVNTFQTILFLCFGAVAIVVIGYGMGGFQTAAEQLQASPATAPLLTRERISPLYFFSYTFIPLSAIAFPHILIFCLTARKMGQFKKTVIFYPLCIMAIWLPCVFLGVMANHVILRLLERYAPLWLAGLLGAGIMAAVMASDSQILALSTMFTEDVFAFYGGKRRFGEAVQVQTGRIFVVLLTVVAYAIAMRAPEAIFDLAIQYAFSGFAALSPLLVAALFWRGSTKWGALASTVWTAAAVAAVAVFQAVVPAPAPGPATVIWSLGGAEILSRTPGGTAVFGFMPVVPMVIVSALLMIVVSRLTRKPADATVQRYFERAA